jgi:hypothetical protein
MYTMILREKHFEATAPDIKRLEMRFLYKADEPPQFRAAASFCLGLVCSSRGDLEDAADAYREGLSVVKHATQEERSVVLVCDDGSFPTSYFMDSQYESIQRNLNVMLHKRTTNHRSSRSPVS